MLKAVIFDLDETLIDWSGFKEDWETLQNRHLQGVFEYLCGCHPLDDIEAYNVEFRKRTNEAWSSARMNLQAPNLGAVLVESALALGVPLEKLDVRQCLEAYRWGHVAGSKAFPEVVEALTLLRDRGLKLGIITNAYQPMWVRDPELEALGLSEFFPDCRFSAADFGYLKPHPSIFQAALECLEVKPDEAVFVGDDLEADVGGAKAAGVYAVLRRSKRYPIDLLDDDIVPDSTIDSLKDLPLILDKVFPGWQR